MIKIGKSIPNVSFYSCQPKDKKELKEIIHKRIKSEGPNCDLNDIDLSLITDMSYLFYRSDFNGDISRWDVQKVKSMRWMFYDSDFNGDISGWDINNVENMSGMFNNSKFNQDISKWNVYNVKYMSWMFSESVFDQNISNWKIREDCNTKCMFDDCHIKEEFKPKSL